MSFFQQHQFVAIIVYTWLMKILYSFIFIFIFSVPAASMTCGDFFNSRPTIDRAMDHLVGGMKGEHYSAIIKKEGFSIELGNFLFPYLIQFKSVFENPKEFGYILNEPEIRSFLIHRLSGDSKIPLEIYYRILGYFSKDIAFMNIEKFDILLATLSNPPWGEQLKAKKFLVDRLDILYSKLRPANPIQSFDRASLEFYRELGVSENDLLKISSEMNLSIAEKQKIRDVLNHYKSQIKKIIGYEPKI